MSPSPRLRILESATDPRLLQLPAVLALVLLTTLAHVLTSFDLGFGQLLIRVPLAAISMLPFFALLFLAHKIVKRNPKLQVPLVLAGYLVGGGLRGALLEFGLVRFEVIAGDAELFRIQAGMAIVALSAVVISYTWSTIQEDRARLSALRNETAALSDAYDRLSLQSKKEMRLKTADLSKEILKRLTAIGSMSAPKRKGELQELVDGLVRPLSQSLAREVPSWRPPERIAKVSLRSVFASLDPAQHLPPITVGFGSVLIASIASSFALFGLQNALLLIVLFTLGLALSMAVSYPIARRFITPLRPPLRDLALTLLFVLVAAPPAAGTWIALQDSEQPDAYVISTFVAVPLFAWIIMIGNSARDQAAAAASELAKTKDQLRWHIKRINLIAWNRQGVTSRLMHGPIQNAIQVGILRIRTLDDEQDSDQVLKEVVTRIESALEQEMEMEPADPKVSLSIIAQTWEGIAEISSSLGEGVLETVSQDAALAGILEDLIQEACSNSIRHGAATKLEITLQALPGVLRVQIEDNGTELDPDARQGLGTEFREACSLSTTHERSGSLNTLIMDLPANQYPQSGTK